MNKYQDCLSGALTAYREDSRCHSLGDYLADSPALDSYGYSLPLADSYIKYLMKSAILEDPNLKAIDVFCRDDDERRVETRYHDFIDFKNYRFVNTDVLTYVNTLRTTHENAKKDKPYFNVNLLEQAHKACIGRI